jgi:hypothetical protein
MMYPFVRELAVEQRSRAEQRRAEEEQRTRQLTDWHQRERAADLSSQHEDGRALDRI